MERVITIVLAALLLTGCGTVWTKPEVLEKQAPILVCPAPTLVERPSLHIDRITPETSDGKVVILYQATVKQLQSYAEDLAEQLQFYLDTSKEYEALRQRLGVLVPEDEQDK